MACKVCLVSLLLVLAFLGRRVDAFVVPNKLNFPVRIPKTKELPRCEPRALAPSSRGGEMSRSTSTSLHLAGASVLSRFAARPAYFRPLLRIAATILTSFFITRRLLWPGLRPDPIVAEPLPPRGPLGCPWFGNNVDAGNQHDGANCFYRKRSFRLGDPSVWMYYFRGTPVTSITSVELISQVNSMEFKYTTKIPDIDGSGLAVELNKDQHRLLRRLVGQAMTEEALREAVPNIQKSAQRVIEDDVVGPSTVMSSVPITMHPACTDFGLDTVQDQLLGLHSKWEQIPIIREILKRWINRTNPFSRLRYLSYRSHKNNRWKAGRYIESLIENQMVQKVKRPDSSTLSKMLSASVVTADGEEHSLAPGQIVDNMFGLIDASVEPIAEILTLSMLLLGSHPHQYKLLVEEQRKHRKENGYQLTYDMLDPTNSPHLNGVVLEALRMGCGSKMSSPRLVTKTLVVGGKQIPQGTKILSNYRLTHQLDGALSDEDDTHMDPFKGFQPERFFVDSDQTPQPADYCPFGIGPRTCLGAPMAFLELKIFLAVFARRVESFDLIHGQTINWDPESLIPRPIDGVEILNITQTY